MGAQFPLGPRFCSHTLLERLPETESASCCFCDEEKEIKASIAMTATAPKTGPEIHAFKEVVDVSD
jgi:hypothetical protein